MHTIQFVSPCGLKPNPRNARTHSKKQIRQIADSIGTYGFTVPVLIDENMTIISSSAGMAARARTYGITPA